MRHTTYSGLSSAGQPDYEAFIPPNPPLWSSTPLSVGQYVPVYQMRRNVQPFSTTTGENMIARNMSHLTQQMLDLYGYDSVPLHGISSGPTSPPYIPNSLPLFSSTAFNISDYQPVWKAQPLDPEDIINQVSPLPTGIRAGSTGGQRSSRFFGNLGEYGGWLKDRKKRAAEVKKQKKKLKKKIDDKVDEGIKIAKKQSDVVVDKEFPDKWKAYTPPAEAPIETGFEEDYYAVGESEEKGFPVIPVVLGLLVAGGVSFGIYRAIKK